MALAPAPSWPHEKEGASPRTRLAAGFPQSISAPESRHRGSGRLRPFVMSALANAHLRWESANSE